MKKFGIIIMAVMLCLVMTACNKQLGTYRAQCQNIVWDKFSITLTLQKGGTFVLEPKKGDDTMIKNFKYKGKFKIEKSDGKYDVLKLTYDQNQNMEGMAPKEVTTEGKISKNGKTVIFTSLYNTRNVTLKK